MPIPVTCPSCLTRFSVSDKYAGKTGPCPKCKSTIKIPELSDQVVIHAPVDSGPKDSKGKSVLKPIRRQEVKLSLPIVIGSVLGSLAVLGVALGFGLTKTSPPVALLGVSSILLAIPLVTAGYWFLRDDELQGYNGRELWIRTAICSFIFAALWGLYSFLPAFVSGYSTVAEMATFEMLMAIGMMIAIGTLAAILSLELETGQGLLLYMLYLVITFILAWVSGTPLSEILPGNRTNADKVPSIQQPAVQPGVPQPQSEQPTAPEEPKPVVPNLLQ